MRIGILGQFPDPDMPDASKAGYRHIEGLARLLSQDNIVTLYPVHKRRLDIDIPAVKVLPIYSSNPITRFIKIAGKVIKERRKLDLLIVHNPTIYALAVVPIGRLFSIPVVVDYVDKLTTPAYSRTKILRLLGFFSEKVFWLMVKNWLTDSSYLADEIKKAKRDANIMFFRGTPPEQGGKEQPLPIKVSKDHINIAYGGALTYDRGVDILINAFIALRSENLHLYITGYGAMKPRLEYMVKEKKLSNISVLFLDNNVVDTFLSKMDILVLPYRNTRLMQMIGFPSKITGYMQAGKAIVVTQMGELPAILEDGKTALLIEPDNEEALRKALIDLITDEGKRRKLGVSAREYFDNNFSEGAVRPRINQYLNNIANSHKRSGHRRV